MRYRIALALLALGCGTPEDAFVGSYAGTYECVGMFDDGAPYSEGPDAQTIRVDQGTDGSIFLAGTCTIPLDVVSGRRAEARRVTCNTSLPDGTAAVYTVDGGAVEVAGAELAYTLRLIVETPAWTLYTTCTFDGERIE